MDSASLTCEGSLCPETHARILVLVDTVECGLYEGLVY